MGLSPFTCGQNLNLPLTYWHMAKQVTCLNDRLWSVLVPHFFGQRTGRIRYTAVLAHFKSLPLNTEVCNSEMKEIKQRLFLSTQYILLHDSKSWRERRKWPEKRCFELCGSNCIFCNMACCWTCLQECKRGPIRWLQLTGEKNGVIEDMGVPKGQATPWGLHLGSFWAHALVWLCMGMHRVWKC